jgi:hypothetical protein
MLAAGAPHQGICRTEERQDGGAYRGGKVCDSRIMAKDNLTARQDSRKVQ